VAQGELVGNTWKSSLGTIVAACASAVAMAGVLPSSAMAAGSSDAHTAQGPPAPRVSTPVVTAAVGDSLITFDEFPEGTIITDEYADLGVIFSGDSPEDELELVFDADNPTTPVLSGTPTFHGTISAQFVVPGTTTQAIVSGFTVDVGFIDDPGAVVVVVHRTGGDEVITTEEFGINTLESATGGITGFTVEENTEEGAGFAIDNLAFTPGVALPPPPPPPPPAPTDPAARCAPYLVFDSRGSGEPKGEMSAPGRDFLDALKSALKGLHHPSKVLRNFNPYPAVSVLDGFNPLEIDQDLNGLGALLHSGRIGAYNDSVRDGERELRTLVQNQASSFCSVTKMILVGYSQGAQVTGNVIEQLPRWAARHVAAAVLFADPKFNSRDRWADRGVIRNGLDGVLGQRPFFPRGGPVVLSYCKGKNPVDPVCHYREFSDLIRNHSQHEIYSRRVNGHRSIAEAAASAVALRLVGR
jgi:cutinase